MVLPRQGKLIAISGPSGAGKTTVVKRLLELCPLPLTVSVSATTRSPRKGEQDGVDYHFLTAEQFATRREAGEFLECFEVFGRGFWYGTLREEVGARLNEGNWVILEIDVQGTMAVIQEYPEAITIFVRPESLEELEQRLRGRGTESEAAIQERLQVASRELEYADKYRYEVINRTVDQTVHEICQILKQAEGQGRC